MTAHVKNYSSALQAEPGKAVRLLCKNCQCARIGKTSLRRWLIICAHGQMWIQLALRYTAVVLADISRHARQRSSIALLPVSRTLH